VQKFLNIANILGAIFVYIMSVIVMTIIAIFAFSLFGQLIGGQDAWASFASIMFILVIATALFWVPALCVAAASAIICFILYIIVGTHKIYTRLRLSA